MKTRSWIVLGVIFLATVVAQLFDGPEMFPIFYAIFGFVGCLVFLFLAKIVGKKLIMRKEDYYGDR
jgi:uncharacterized membrane protein YuzA (DUF378 family)